MEAGNKEIVSFELELANMQFELYTHIASLCGCPHDARDILQEVNKTLCRRKDEFDPSRGKLIAWAVTLARFEVLHWRDRQKRAKIIFSSDMIEEVANTLEEEISAPVDVRLGFLEECLQTLSKHLREMLVAHHGERQTLASIAQRMKRDAHSVANSLYVARGSLRKCIEGKIQAGGGMS
jgi:RNA polymerase sigma-70 factor (ECF subfamily)